MPCDLKMELVDGPNITEVFKIDADNTYNDGTVDNVDEWPWENFRLPFVDLGRRLKITGELDIKNGALNLDNIHIFTRQR